MTQQTEKAMNWALTVAGTLVGGIALAAIVYVSRQVKAAENTEKTLHAVLPIIAAVPPLEAKFNAHCDWANDQKDAIENVAEANKAHLDEKFKMRTEFDVERWGKQEKVNDRIIELLEKMDRKIDELRNNK